MLFVDSDNALGSRSGDIDDGLALAALIRSRAPLSAIATCFGNTSESEAFSNHVQLAALAGYTGPILRGAATPTQESEASAFLAANPGLRVLALGPLTNVAHAIRRGAIPSEVIGLVTNYRLATPASRFFDFNHACDSAAMRTVVDSPVPLTIVPLNVARRLRLRFSELPGNDDIGRYLRQHSARWFRRARWLKASATIPGWDVVPALYAIAPQDFTVKRTTLRLHRWGRASYGTGGRDVNVVTDFDPQACRARFLALLASQE